MRRSARGPRHSNRSGRTVSETTSHVAVVIGAAKALLLRLARTWEREIRLPVEEDFSSLELLYVFIIDYAVLRKPNISGVVLITSTYTRPFW